MPHIVLQGEVERRHAPLARVAAGALAHSGGWTSVVICDDAAPMPARRADDLLIVLRRGTAPRVERTACNRVELTYADPADQMAVAALVAAAARDRAPVLLDPESAATLQLAERIAASDIPVLIQGPTGTGKEVVSRFIHTASARAYRPFVAINCAAMPETMLEAMLFGHRKGAFTGASEAGEGFFRAADGGTLLLDEVAEMPLALQAKLLRALQEGEVVPIGATKPVLVDVRVIACANRDLPQEVASGRFRADLYYRLNVFPLTLQALTERRGDIAPLAFAMLLRHAATAGAPGWIGPAAMARLSQHPWPGNVRELENVMRRALLLARGEHTLGAEHIVFDPVAAPSATAQVLQLPVRSVGAPAEEDTGRLASIVRQLEAQAIADALEEFGGNRLQTARKLGISERTLRYRLAGMRSGELARAGGVR